MTGADVLGNFKLIARRGIGAPVMMLVMLAMLAVAVLYMGIYPKPFTDVMNTSVTDLLRHVALSKLN